MLSIFAIAVFFPEAQPAVKTAKIAAKTVKLINLIVITPCIFHETYP
jgi:hypothetical protein